MIPEITLTGKRVRNGLDRRDEMLVSIEMHLFAGETYAWVDHFGLRQQITTKFRSPFRTINVLGQPRRPVILDAMRAPVAKLVDEMATKLQCAPLTATMSIVDGKLSVPVGSYHGMRQNALAVANGTDTPWQIMRVTSVTPMSSVLTPLNEKRDINTLAGRTAEFMEVPQ